ncbi:flavodoxin [Nocardia neocaledoniensis NBRC 108232]|uniref:Flavodoxin n=1 Tax=Nocardia neocaledoniensis TaxID=236511 RepID=A0A317NMH7_9NOCA|nr:flavodoxin family protein [Nocardia neocaledoniensis]PWV76003.1 flavodoxin [Nocardia neocaledoniensis]GEM30638.1 flavodoxin [Nocardia neocaledoniensis NBRC 108232]
MKAIIVCTSSSHGNTRKVADAIGDVLGAKVVDPGEISPVELAEYDLVGFGSGVYFMALDKRLRAFVDAVPEGQGCEAFVFATSGMSEPSFRPYLRNLGDQLTGKGYELVGGFACRGLDTMGPLALIGGLNKGRPNAEDLTSARGFAEQLRARFD